MKNNPVSVGREFEKQAFKLLKERFDKVIWLSRNKLTTFDFKCVKNNKVYFGEAKVTKFKPVLKYSQRTADFVIQKKGIEVIFIPKKKFKIEVGIEGEVTVIKIGKKTKKKIDSLKKRIGLKSIDETIIRMYDIITKFKLSNELSEGK